MPRTITVKGVGKVSAKPDYVIISLSLEAKDKDYDRAMAIASDQIEQLNVPIERLGFEKGSLKTTNFNVSTSYESVKERNGNYKRLFDGYECSQRLKLAFDFDTKLLAQTLSAIGSCVARPELNITFTVKNPAEINDMLLRDATTNAKKKAELLCEASGVNLGQLMTIDYNRGELSVISKTRFEAEDCLMPLMAKGMFDADIEPDDIDVNDTVTFVWEIF